MGRLKSQISTWGTTSARYKIKDPTPLDAKKRIKDFSKIKSAGPQGYFPTCLVIMPSLPVHYLVAQNIFGRLNPSSEHPFGTTDTPVCSPPKWADRQGNGAKSWNLRWSAK